MGRRSGAGGLLIDGMNKIEQDGYLGAFLRRSDEGVVFALFEGSSCPSGPESQNKGFQKR